MSTTVTYKGSTLTTATNQTRVLKTAGKYMEDDVTITDESTGGSAIVVTEELDEHGGTIKYINAVDLSNDTVSSAVLLEGYTAHDFQGNLVEGGYAGPALQEKTVSPSTSSQNVTPDNGYNGLSKVVVNAMPAGTAGTPTASKGTVSNHSVTVTPSVTNTTGYITGSTKTGTGVTVTASELASGNKSITSNGANIDVVGYSTVSVSVSGGTPNLQTKSVTPTESAQTITADTGYDGLEEVDVGAISSTYVGSGITQRSSTDLSASGATVTVPAGYYSAQATKSVTTMTLPTSASSTSSGASKATIGRSTSAQYINIPAGYNSAAAYYTISAVANMTLPTSASSTSSGTSKATISRSTSAQYINIPVGYNDTAAYYTISATPNGSATGPSSLSGTSATISTGTNTITLTKTGVTTTPTVSAGYVSSATASTATVALTASVTTKAAATYNTSSSDQTIASGTYLTGAQTIKAVTVSGLAANKILSGTTVKIGDVNDDDRIASVSGSVTFQTYYTGSSAPSSSQGVNGDIYLQTS